jgi:ADP-ribose pyrophosphatase YjhB (NUDIX family)
MQKHFHLRVRAIIRSGERVLLARMKGKSYSFLPGGHHEVGETLVQTLVRELREELGVEAVVKNYLGVVENGWPEDEEYHYEINHIFTADVPELRAGASPASKEDELEFFWSRADEFERFDLRPTMMRALIASWMNGDARIWQEGNFE